MQHLQPNTTLQGGKYRIERVLGQGGFGITYLARNTVFDIDVAIKEFFMKDENDRDGSSVTMPNTTKQVLFLGQMEKFKKEAKRMFAIKNEHIVGVQDLFEENGTAYYVMDFVDGENLAERLKHTGKPMTEEEVLDILPQILNALESVHNAGIWHLDLKPANIMVDKSGNIKLIDFGASKQLNAQKGGATTSTAISYTNGYAPREQMEQNYDKFGPWTDIYALGATLYNLLTNKRPPLPTDIDDDESEDKHKALPFPDGIGSLKFLVLQMMKTNRMQRLQSIDAVIGKLSRKVEPKQVPQKQPTTHGSTLYDDEATIIAEPKTKKERKTEAPKPKPKESDSGYSQTPPKQETYTSSHIEDTGGEGHDKTIIILMVAAFLIVVLFLLNYGSCGNRTVSAPEPTPAPKENTVQKVERMQYTTAIGGCQYTGPVDEQRQPNGEGEAFFNDGRYYSGTFEHGVLTGDNCYFKYANGDTFRGKFRNNSFYYGTYTIASDKSYYVGSYKNGQPDGGTWYNKNGKVIDNI